MVALITFNRAFPDGPAVGDEMRRIPSFRSDELSVLRSEGIEILDLVNGERVAAGVAQLSWSSALTDVAIDYANEMYVGGFFCTRFTQDGRCRLAARRSRHHICSRRREPRTCPQCRGRPFRADEQPWSSSQHPRARVHSCRDRRRGRPDRSDRRTGVFPSLSHRCSLCS